MPAEIILASGSPRRRELLAAMGVKFEVVTADVEEIMPHETDDGPGIARHNAMLKAETVAKSHLDRWVLGVDTIVVLGRRVLGKPATLEVAREYLAALGGHTHEVISGCCLSMKRGSKVPSGGDTIFSDISRVTFRALTPELIDNYLAAVHVLDKAGAYALQQHGDWLVEKIEGSRDNIIGLPTEVLRHVLSLHNLL